VKRLLTDTVYRYAYLPIIAAWLFTFSSIFSNYFSYSTSPVGVRRTLQQHLQRQELAFANVMTDTPLLRRMAGDSIDEADLSRLTALDAGIYLYRLSAGADPVLRYWSTQRAVPVAGMLEASDDEYLAEMPNGQYAFIRRRVVVGGSPDWLLCALVPVRMDFFVENDYLRKAFVGAPDVEEHYRISTSVKDIPIRSIEGRVVYRIERRPEAEAAGGGWVAILLRVLGLLLVCFYLHMTALGVNRQLGPAAAIGTLAVAVGVLRAVTYLLPAATVYGGNSLFDPGVYRTGAVSRSLGDVLVNSLLFVWVMLLARSLPALGGGGSRRTGRAGWVRDGVGALVLLSATWLAADTVRTLVSDSAISYDVTDFFRMDGYTVAGFFAIVCLSMGYFILSQTLFRVFGAEEGSDPWRGFILTAALGLLLLSFLVPTSSRGFGIALLAWVMGYRWLSVGFPGRRRIRPIEPGVVLWLVFFSASITAVLFTENRRREKVMREAAAVKLALQTDPAGDYLVDIATSGIGNGLILSNLDRFRNPGLAQRLKDSLISANYMGYTNRFDTRIYLYAADGTPLSPSDRPAYDTLNTIYTLQARPTGVSGMRYYEKDFTSFSYIYRREVRDEAGVVRAVLFMVSSPRRFREEALYPELVRQPGGTVLDRQPGYAFAVYDSLKLKFSRNDFDFPVRLVAGQVPPGRLDWRREGGHDVLFYRVDAHKVVVIARRSRDALEAMTLFAYIFCASLLLVGLFQLASVMVRSRFDPGAMLQLSRSLSIRRQIHGTVILLSLFSFLVIGAATIYFFIERYDTGNREMLSRTLQSMSAELEYRLSAEGGQTDNARLQLLAENISEAHNADVNLYGPGGDLLASSQPFVYEEGILSRWMNPVAYWRMKRQGKVQLVQTEDFGQLAYMSIYRPFHMPGREEPGYVNIPYFASNRGLKQEISGFLVALINLNTFVFLVAGVISVLITNRITRSFTWIGRRMQELSLRDHNEEIQWDRDDEIGVLVSQYNAMVRKLMQSAEALARQEREGAWREMAKQVAHEIKNPLTPMKLSIQFLRKAIDRDAPDVRRISLEMSSTLIEQIEHLSNIAGDFAEFANIGTSDAGDFDLRGVIRSVVSLHAMSGDADIGCDLPERPVSLHADKTQMNRLFTNLLRNAVEAVPRDRRAVIRTSVRRYDTFVDVSVQDNGTGIPAETRSKIFRPNFTTKSSGTGLGLAMSWSIVEKAGGHIWFDTESGAGTVFHVRLPLAGHTSVPGPGELPAEAGGQPGGTASAGHPG
jgi:signal transduction histidine kinase